MVHTVTDHLIIMYVQYITKQLPIYISISFHCEACQTDPFSMFAYIYTFIRLSLLLVYLIPWYRQIVEESEIYCILKQTLIG